MYPVYITYPKKISICLTSKKINLSMHIIRQRKYNANRKLGNSLKQKLQFLFNEKNSGRIFAIGLKEKLVLQRPIIRTK